VNGCPKNTITGRPFVAGDDTCHAEIKYMIGRRDKDYKPIHPDFNEDVWCQYRRIEHKICIRCGLDISVYLAEREEETPLPDAKVG